MSRGLPNNVRQCLEKSKDSSLLAIETYNKPAIKFRSGGYIVLMVIGWTSLFHAIFFKKKIKPFYRIKGSIKFDRRDGDFRYWDLSDCLKEYYTSDTNNPIRKNIEFFIPLRNKIEHKSIPELDADIFAECQALLLNYDKMLEKEFGIEHCLRESLSFSLQLFPSSKNLADAIKSNPDAKKIKEFIKNYRSLLTTDVLESGQYSFKAFLIQVANHKTEDSLPIQFIRYDDLTEDEKRNLNRIAALVKVKERPVSGKDLILPSKVVEMVQRGIGNLKINRNGKSKNKFNQETHTRCWKKYNVRPKKGDGNPAETNPRYCIFDEPTGQYRYTKEWVHFLIGIIKTESVYNSLYEDHQLVS